MKNERDLASKKECSRKRRKINLKNKKYYEPGIVTLRVMFWMSGQMIKA